MVQWRMCSINVKRDLWYVKLDYVLVTILMIIFKYLRLKRVIQVRVTRCLTVVTHIKWLTICYWRCIRVDSCRVERDQRKTRIPKYCYYSLLLSKLHIVTIMCHNIFNKFRWIVSCNDIFGWKCSPKKLSKNWKSYGIEGTKKLMKATVQKGHRSLRH